MAAACAMNSCANQAKVEIARNPAGERAEMLLLADAVTEMPKWPSYYDFSELHNENSPLLLEKILAMSEMEASPENNLEFAHNVDLLIDEAGMSRDEALADIGTIVEELSVNTQSSMNSAAYIRQVMDHYLLLSDYDSLMRDFPDLPLDEEYAAWSKFNAAYLDEILTYMSETASYSSLPMDQSERVVAYLDKRRNALAEEREMLGSSVIVKAREDNVPTFADLHPAENREIEALYNQWLAARRKIADMIPAGALYMNLTAGIMQPSAYSFQEEI